MVKLDYSKCLIFGKEKKKLIASIGMAHNIIFPLNMAAEQKVALSSMMDDIT